MTVSRSLNRRLCLTVLVAPTTSSATTIRISFTLWDLMTPAQVCKLTNINFNVFVEGFG